MLFTFYKFFNDNKENWRPNFSNSFSLNIAELIAHLNGEKKNYLLAPFCKFTSFKTLAANLCIIWSESNDIFDKKVEKIQKVEPSLNFECKQKYWK